MNCDHHYRAGVICIVLFITMLVYVIYSPSTIIDHFVDAARCGVDLPPCQGEHVRCMNGYCKSDIAPVLPSHTGLSVFP